jgi:hypothetical protein
MKLTKRELRQLIREAMLNEGMFDNLLNFQKSPILQKLGVVDAADAASAGAPGTFKVTLEITSIMNNIGRHSRFHKRDSMYSISPAQAKVELEMLIENINRNISLWNSEYAPRRVSSHEPGTPMAKLLKAEIVGDTVIEFTYDEASFISKAKGFDEDTPNRALTKNQRIGDDFVNTIHPSIRRTRYEDMDDSVKTKTAVYRTLLNLLGHAYADQTRDRHRKIRMGYEG